MEPTTDPARARPAWRQLPPVLGLIPLGLALAVFGTFEPWFRPSARGQVLGVVHVWNLSRIGLFAVLGLLVATVQLGFVCFGPASARREADVPVFVASVRRCMIVCAVALVFLGLAWFYAPHGYAVDTTQFVVSADLDTQVQVSAVSVSRGAAIGFFATLAGCVLAFAASVIALVPYGSSGNGTGITHIPPHPDDPGSRQA